MESLPQFKGNLRDSISILSKDAIKTKSLLNQFDILINTPLSKLNPQAGVNFTGVIIVDALDECNDKDGILPVLQSFSSLGRLSNLRIRVILTSRSIQYISYAFRAIGRDGGPYKAFALQNEFHEETKRDIRASLRTRFSDIKSRRQIRVSNNSSWPTYHDLDFVVRQATTPSPLIIYAATLLRFIDDPNRPSNPVTRLQSWIKQCGENKSQLSQMYEPKAFR